MAWARTAARLTLGGFLAATTAGLAALAEPLAPPLPTDWHALAAGPEALRVSVASSAPPLRPAGRPLAMVRTGPPVVQSGAAVRPVARGVFVPPARWDGHREGEDWTIAAMEAMDRTRHDLRDIVPADIDAWCPGYEDQPPHWRAAFWVATISALARYESTWNPRAVGGGGAWHGLLQIAPATARAYGCEASTGAALQDGPANVACAVRIMSRTVARDGVIAAGGRGIAADWGPMARSGPRDAIRAWVREQPFCERITAVAEALRPLARPHGTSPALVLAALEPRGRR
ncbi:transglycosylase SLT domain-containing protein [Rubellimicrobium sp. CFH 75288]|uniref:transglycosylase SLT domain-containing protein n=1 Tax=Rubellimicrobium sp. CFH 75288 TaxID=2697034 RepID=UPI00273A5381|nr:transglycosylase SLT domain-containing protein [Rubellimicrobium sp. CFH 75288]